MRSDVLPGDIRITAGSYAPGGWATCDGSTVKVADQRELFQAIGTTYGGDGKTNFALPNFQAQVPIHITGGMKVGQAGKGGIKLPAHVAKLRYVIALRSTFGEPFLGEIRNFAFRHTTKGWARCEGQLLPIMQFTALFTLFQTTFGGNGTTTFALPDLRGTAAGNDGLRCVGTNFCICVEGGIYPPRGE